MHANDLEVVKAVAEGTAAGATGALQRLVLNLLGGAASEAGEELELMVRGWRERRSERYGRLVVDRLTGRPRRSIPPKVLFPAFEYATLEDRPELLDLWVELLATAGSEGADDVDRVYVEILRDMTPLDARVLQWVRTFPPELDGNDPRTIPEAEFVGPAPEAIRPRATKTTAMQALRISNNDFELVASRLGRLGLCEPGRLIFPTRLGSSSTGPRVYDAITLTPLGIAFVDACAPRRRAPDGPTV
ncbi:MAG: Abi-alpha family protein [Acidobacteriota bacterium]|nr:Abi-alpha family protein [Acidobacteriota bacterium]